MGIKERQDRERQAVRESILDAARDLFMAEGYRQVSIRKIAERIEYSPAAIYGYFPGKDDIFFALAAEGFRLLRDRVVDARGPEDLPPLERMRRCFWAFYDFSAEQPAYFELMFVDRSVPTIADHWGAFTELQELLAFAEAQIQAVIDAGDLPADLDACTALHVLWACLMGPTVLHLAGRMAPTEDARALARDVLESTLAGLAGGVRPTFVPCETMHADDDQPGSPEPSGAPPHDA